jgi:hypothetical protein
MLQFLLWGGGPAKVQASPSARRALALAGVNLWKNKTINRLTHGIEEAIQGRRGKDVAGRNRAKMEPQVKALNAPLPAGKMH